MTILNERNIAAKEVYIYIKSIFKNMYKYMDIHICICVHTYLTQHIYVITYAADFLTPSFVICISKHHHHHHREKELFQHQWLQR
jgi:hypothetical protein